MEVIKYSSVSGKTDDRIVEIVLYLAKDSKRRVVVATNDAELRKSLKASGVKTIYLRARKHLEVS